MRQEESGSQLLCQRGGDNGVTVESEDPLPSRGPKKLSLYQTVSFLFSSIGGTAIFIATSTILNYTGSVGVSLIVILVSGLQNYSLAMCFSEVATLLKKSGGPFFFLLSIFGPFPAFMFFWGFMFFIIIPTWSMTPFGAAIYTVQLFFPGCHLPMMAVKLLAVTLLALVVVVNCLYIQYVNKVQNFLSFSKVVAILIIFVCGIYGWANGEASITGSFDNVFKGSATEPGQIALSLMTGMFMYGGWQIITFLVEEIKFPEKTVPRALQFSIGLVIAIYELVMLCYYVLVTPGEMRYIDAVAVVFVWRVSRPLGPLMTLLITLTSVGSLNAFVFGQSNFVTSVAKSNQLPRIFASLSVRYKMPWMPTVTLFSLSAVLIMLGDLQTMIEMLGFYSVIMSLCVLACLLVLRITQPHKHRPIKVWLVTAISQFVLNVALLVMSIIQKPEAFGRMILFLLAGVPVYIICITWKNKPAAVDNFMEKTTRFIQKIFMLELI